MAEYELSIELLLSKYLIWLKNDDIDYLKYFNEEENKFQILKDDKEEIKKFIIKLQSHFEDANNELNRYNKDKMNSGETTITLSEFLKSFELHQDGKKLWSKLTSCALNKIQSSSKGNSTLFEFLEESSKFEDLLYGLEPYYRDHTLHSLWVYLIGEYLLREPLKNLKNEKFNWYLFNDIEKEKKDYNYPDEFVEHSIEKKNNLSIKVENKKDSIWCIIALCHDLGYSLEKLEKLNERVKIVLDFFDISEYKHAGYSLDIEHQFLVSQFLELMAMDVRIVPSSEYSELFRKFKEQKENYKKELGELNKKDKEELTDKDKNRIKEIKDIYPDLKISEKEREELEEELYLLEKKVDSEKTRKEKYRIRHIKGKLYPRRKISKEEEKEIEENVLIKCYRDDSSYWHLCKAIEKKQHGILSSYLIYKTLGIFSEASIVGPAEEWGLSDEEALENIIHGDILFAIAQHTFDFTYLNEINSLADILIIADELEEFSRYGRQMQSRKYHDTTANAKIKFIPAYPKRGEEVKISIIYDVEKHLKEDDFYLFFKRKASRLCKLYSLEQFDNKNKFCQITKIKMTVASKNKEIKKPLYFQLSKDEGKNHALLPPTKIYLESEKKEKHFGRFEKHYLKCVDDKIIITDLEDVEDEITFEEWFKKYSQK